MDYVIAIPSYNRPVDCQKSLLLVKKMGLLKITTLFVVQDEYDSYKKECTKADMMPSKIVVGVKGLAAQRRFIYDYYEEDTCIFMMDDDVEDYIDVESKSALPDMNQYLRYGFEECKKNNCRLLGLYPACNAFFMQDNWTTDLKFCVGCSYGIIKSGPEPYLIDDEILSLKEDYFRTCAYFKADGKIIRLNFVSPKTKYAVNKGGLESLRSLDNFKRSAEHLKQLYPDWVTLYTRTKTGIAEIKLHQKTVVKQPELINSALQNLYQIKNLDPQIFETLKQYLIEDPPKNSDSRKNSGYGRSQPYGILNRCWAGGNMGTGLVTNNDFYPHIWEEAYKISKKIVPKSINWTTLMVNMNYEAVPHIDRNNTGPSLVVAFGDYTGGELVTIDLSGNETPYNIKYSPVVMDASIITHYVKPITSGTRYSIIFFRTKISKAIKKKYGDNLTLEELIALLPAKKEGQSNGEIRIPE